MSRYQYRCNWLYARPIAVLALLASQYATGMEKSLEQHEIKKVPITAFLAQVEKKEKIV